MNSNENVSPAVMGRVMKELRTLMRHPLDGITVHVDESNLTTFVASFDGPVGTPYEKGEFRAQLSLSHDFPQTPPKGTFLTKIFHPNVASNGDICVNTLKRDWQPSHGFGHVLSIIRCLLIHPNPASALNEEAGRLLMESYDEYARRARIFTKIHARKRMAHDSSRSTRSLDRNSSRIPSAAAATGESPRPRRGILASSSSTSQERGQSPFSERNSNAERLASRSSSSSARDVLDSPSLSPESGDGYSSDEQNENDDGYSDDGYSDDDEHDENNATVTLVSKSGVALSDGDDDGYSDDDEEDGENAETNREAASSDYSPKRPSPASSSSSRRSCSASLCSSIENLSSPNSHIHSRSASPNTNKETDSGDSSNNTRQLRPKRKKLRL